MANLTNYVATCHNNLLPATAVLQYLASRGVVMHSILQWKLGYDADFGIVTMGGRIILPILDELGGVVGVTGRTPGEDGVGPKYLHLPFPRSHWLYGLHLPAEGTPVLVEGHLDAILLRQVGFSAYALMGSSLSLWQAAHLVWFAKEQKVILYPDYDKIEAAEQWKKQLQRMGLEGIIPQFLYSPFMDKNADPGWLVQNRPEFITQTIEEVR